MSKIDEIRARCEAATPGPWGCGKKDTVIGGRIGIMTQTGAQHINYIAYTAEREIGNGISQAEHDANADFVAHSREDIPFLMAEVERIRDAANVIVPVLQAENAALKRERDALLKEIENDCEKCIHDGEDPEYSNTPGYRCNTPICGHGGAKGNWKWRGPQDVGEGEGEVK